jgi:hypothetical protein
MSMATIEPADAGLARWASVLVPASQLAERIANTEFVPTAMRGKPDVITAAIMYGDELRIGPMQALAGIHVVEGRPQPSAELMRALILRDGHTLTVLEMSGTRVRVAGLRRGAPESERMVVEWSIDMARAAGLLNRPNWQRYPRAMLLARATGDLARALFSDVVKGLSYVAEEAADWPGWDQVAPEAADPEPRAPIRRQRKHEPAAIERPPIAPPDQSRYGTATDDPRPPKRPAPMDPTPAVEDTPLPEPPDDEPPTEGEPPPEPVPIGVRPLRALHAKLGEVLGSVATRSERLALCSAIVGHRIDSTNDLTRDDGYRVLSALDRIVTGEAYFTLNDDGTMNVHDGPGGAP